MNGLENSRKQASSKFRKAYKALMDIAGKVDDVRTQLIAALVALVKGYPELSISTRDARLTFYQDMKMSTYDGKGDTFINVHTGKAVKCSTKNAGLPKNSDAVYVQEQLSKIDRACDGDLTVLLGWTGSDGKELAPSLRDVTEFTKQTARVVKKEKGIETPTKTVGQVLNQPAQATHDISKAREQLKRLDTVLAQCNSAELIEQWTGKILKLANSICSEVVEQEAKEATQEAQKSVAA